MLEGGYPGIVCQVVVSSTGAVILALAGQAARQQGKEEQHPGRFMVEGCRFGWRGYGGRSAGSGCYGGGSGD